MEGTKAFHFYQLMKKEYPVVFFTGVIRQNSLPEYSRLLKDQVKLSPNSKMILLTIFVELAQNILRYSAEQSEGEGIGLIWVTEEPSEYLVHSGNVISLKQVEIVRTELAALVSLNAEELKALRKERLNHAPPVGSKGAGLGLLEVKRRSTKPVEYAFIPVDNEHMFLSITANVPRESI